MLVVSIIKRVKELRIRIRQEYISMESITYAMLLDPLSLLRLLRCPFLLVNVISKLIVSNNIGIELLSILYAIRIIVILRRCFNNQT